MRKYIRGCKVRFYHAQYIPCNRKPLKTYMASKACHPNECFDTTPCNGIFPVTRPFFIFSALSECFAIVLCKSVFATRQGSWQMQVSDTIMDQSSMILLGPATWPWSNEPHECFAIVLCNHAPAVTGVRGRHRCQKKRNQNRISLFLVYKLSYTHQFLYPNGQAISHTTATIVCLKISAIYSRFIMYSLSSSNRS